VSQDIPSVIALYDFLKTNKHHGFSIVLLDGDPALHCQPGVTPADKERWGTLEKAIELFHAAEPDMRHCIANRMIRLPMHPGWE